MTSSITPVATAAAELDRLRRKRREMANELVDVRRRILLLEAIAGRTSRRERRA